MIENREVKIAIIVGIIMITVCLLAFIFSKSNNTTPELLDIKVYKLFNKEGSEDEHEYRACKINVDDIKAIQSEYNKIMRLSESKKTKGQINGDYKIMVEDKYIAFDADESNNVYRGDTSALYNYNSTIYEYVKKVCE